MPTIETIKLSKYGAALAALEDAGFVFNAVEESENPRMAGYIFVKGEKSPVGHTSA